MMTSRLLRRVIARWSNHSRVAARLHHGRRVTSSERSLRAVTSLAPSDVTVLVTGGAGFIGSHLTDRLVSRGQQVLIVDSLDPFYDPAVKRRNIANALSTGCARLI